MNPLLRLIEAIARAVCKAWFEELRRQKEVEVVGGGADVTDDVNGSVDDAINHS